MNNWTSFNFKMKKEYQYIVLVLAFTTCLLWIVDPLDGWLKVYGETEIVRFIIKIIVRILILAGLFWLIRKLNITPFIGNVFKIQNPLVLSLPMCIIVLGFMGNWDTYKSADLAMLVKFIVTDLLIGFNEEFLFRGIILSLFILAFIQNKKPIFWGVLLSSAIFALVHFMNLRHQPGNYAGITSQVLFAFAMGIFLTGLFLRTGNILVVVLFHACINMIMNTSNLRIEFATVVENAEAPINEWSFSFLSIILFGFFVFAGFFMVKQADESSILEKVRKIKLYEKF